MTRPKLTGRFRTRTGWFGKQILQPLSTKRRRGPGFLAIATAGAAGSDSRTGCRLSL